MKYLIYLIIGLFFTSCGLFQKNTKADREFYDFDNNTTAENTEQTAPQPTKSETAEATSPSHDTSNVRTRFEKVEIVTGAIDYSIKYFIILGSFKEQQNALNMTESLASKGFSPRILKNEAGFFRVSGYDFDSEKAARIEIANIREKYPEYSDLWLLVKE